MADKLAEAFIEVRAHVDRLEADFNKARGATNREMSSMSGMVSSGLAGVTSALAAAAAAGVAAIGLVAAASTAFVAHAISDFSEFEKKMNEVFTLLPGISKDSMGAMQDDVMALSKEMNILPTEIVPALYQALSAGVPQDTVFDFLKTAQKAAKGGVADLTTSVDALSSVVNAYGSDVISVEKASDLMFTAVRLGKTDFKSLAATMSNVTPTASGLSLSFDNVTAAIAAITAQGTPTAQAMTQMRALLGELSKAGGEADKTFREVAGVGFQDFIAQGNNLADALQLMERHAKDSNVLIKDLFSSTEAGGAALQLTGRGAERFSEFLKEMGDSAGATGAAFKKMSEGLAEGKAEVNAAIERFTLKVGEAFGPAMGPIRDMMLEIIELAESELIPVFEAIGMTLGNIDPDTSGMKEMFQAVGEGLIDITDYLLAVTTTIDSLVGPLQTIATEFERIFHAMNPFAKMWTKAAQVGFEYAGGLSGQTRDERASQGLSVRDNYERLMASRKVRDAEIAAEKEILAKEQEARDYYNQLMQERNKDSTSIEKNIPAVKETPAVSIEGNLRFLNEALRAAQGEEKRLRELKMDQRAKSIDNGFVGFEQFGQMIQEQLFQAERDKKNEEFQQKVEAFEKNKARLLEENAAFTKQIADRLEKISTAT